MLSRLSTLLSTRLVEDTIIRYVDIDAACSEGASSPTGAAAARGGAADDDEETAEVIRFMRGLRSFYRAVLTTTLRGLTDLRREQVSMCGCCASGGGGGGGGRPAPAIVVLTRLPCCDPLMNQFHRHASVFVPHLMSLVTCSDGTVRRALRQLMETHLLPFVADA